MTRAGRQSIARPPGATLLHPVFVAALAVWIVNDHLFKARWPGFVTGKLSDVAGMVVVPLVLQALYELLSSRSGEVERQRANRALVLAAAATALGFSAVELWEPAAFAYRAVLGALQWPFFAVVELTRGGALPPLRPVDATADVGDLATAPVAFVAVLLGWHREGLPRPRAPKRAPGAGEIP